jgi:hypothetical protein
LAQQVSGGVPGSQAFLGALQDATTSLWSNLSSEEQDQYAELAKEWSEDRPPKDIQSKYVDSQALVLYFANHNFKDGLSSLPGSDCQRLPDTTLQDMWDAVYCVSGL